MDRAEDTIEWTGIDRRQKHWHMERGISVTHLITTASLIASLFIFASRMDTRVTVLETEVSNGKITNTQLRAEMKESNAEIKQYLVRIESKLDKKMDKNGQ